MKKVKGQSKGCRCKCKSVEYDVRLERMEAEMAWLKRNYGAALINIERQIYLKVLERFGAEMKREIRNDLRKEIQEAGKLRAGLYRWVDGDD